MRKYELPFKINLQMFGGEPEPNHEPTPEPEPTHEPKKIVIDGKTYDAESIKAIEANVQKFRSQAGDYKKQLDDKNSEGLTELEKAQNNKKAMA